MAEANVQRAGVGAPERRAREQQLLPVFAEGEGGYPIGSWTAAAAERISFGSGK